jgi:hypothetical protein
VASFSVHVVKPLHQLHRPGTPDNRRRKLRLHFDNSQCHIAQGVNQEMEHLRCRRILHLLYSPDFAICDFYLFVRLMEEVVTLLRGISGEKKSESWTAGLNTVKESQTILVSIITHESKVINSNFTSAARGRAQAFLDPSYFSS